MTKSFLFRIWKSLVSWNYSPVCSLYYGASNTTKINVIVIFCSGQNKFENERDWSAIRSNYRVVPFCCHLLFSFSICTIRSPLNESSPHGKIFTRITENVLYSEGITGLLWARKTFTLLTDTRLNNWILNLQQMTLKSNSFDFLLGHFRTWMYRSNEICSKKEFWLLIQRKGSLIGERGRGGGRRTGTEREFSSSSTSPFLFILSFNLYCFVCARWMKASRSINKK